MLVTYDPQADATYVTVSDAPVASTDALSDLVAVDLDAAGVPVGVEVLKAPGAVDADDEEMTLARYPGLRAIFDTLRRTTAQST